MFKEDKPTQRCQAEITKFRNKSYYIAMIFWCVANHFKSWWLKTTTKNPFYKHLPTFRVLTMWALFKVSHPIAVGQEAGSAGSLLGSHLHDGWWRPSGNSLSQPVGTPRHRPSMCPGLPWSVTEFHEHASQSDQAKVLSIFMT